VFNALVRKVLGLLNGNAEAPIGETDSTEPRVDPLGALWTRDYQGQPAQSWTPLTPSDSTDQTVPFRALRFDGAGTVKVDLIKSDGTRSSGVTRNVAAGEVWAASLTAIPRIYSGGTTATGIDGLG
jgi:hypothetical protein